MTPNDVPHKKARGPERFFTLIEILAAMAVLSLLMLMLFQFFASAQRAWTNTSANTDVFENARVIFDVIQRDLESAVAREDDDIAKNDIQFCLSDPKQSWPTSATFGPNNPGGVLLQFVSANADDGTLSEIRYQLSSTPANRPDYEIGYCNGLQTQEPQCFMRASRDMSNAAYRANPYSNSPADFVTTSTNTDSSRIPQSVAEGVMEMTFSCYDSVTGWWPLGATHPIFPETVTVRFTLLDTKSYELWKRLNAAGNTTAKNALRDRQARVFSKTFYLNRRQ
jgi:type II secretory pathway pseudopilin PulG